MEPGGYEDLLVGGDAAGGPRPHAQVHLLSPTDKCKVCNEPAAKHVHYGAMTCFSCRAFFRRSIQNKTASTYVCRRSRNCEINLRTRKNCQFCRYAKCISAGMKPSWVLSEDERQRRFRKNRERGPGPQQPEQPPAQQRHSSHNKEKHSQPGGTGGFQELALESPMFEPQQEPQALVVKKEQPQSPALAQPGPSFLVKTEAASPAPAPAPAPVPSLKTKIPSQSSPNVIVQPHQRPHLEPGSYPAPAHSLVLKQEAKASLYEAAESALARVVSPAQASRDLDWDSNYEDDIYTSDEEVGSYKPRLSTEPEVKFCDDEWFQMEKLVKEHNDKYRSVNFGEELIKEIIMCSMFGIPVSTSAAISGYRLTVERITRIAHNLDCFTDLPKNDQATLLMENADLLVNLRGAIFFDSKNKGVNQILISMGIEDMDTIKSIYTPLLRENSMKHIDYKTFNSIQTVANPAVETRYSSMQARVASLLSSDDIITVLTTYIILFSDDFCSLMDRRRVEQTQERFIRMLQRYIYSLFPRSIARIKLANTLDMVTCLREMADIKKMRKINVNVKVP